MEAIWSAVTYLVIFLYGIFIGSFLNVVILRIPLKQSITKQRSHCMTCGYQLSWYDLFPLFSWLFLKGKCRKCGAKISAQYPIIEGANGILYVLIFFSNLWSELLPDV
jgi:leader peptidase (prepilin peptidase)/N-methyltransferase